MGRKKIKVHYFWPTVITSDAKIKLLRLGNHLEILSNVPMEERVFDFNNEVVQLKHVELVDNRWWHLSFLRLKDDSPFKTTLNTPAVAVELEADEFIGEEVCAIFDIQSNILAMQNNRYSLSYRGMAQFFTKFIELGDYIRCDFIPLTYPKRYTEISDEEFVTYKSLILNFADMKKLKEFAGEDKFLDELSSLGNHLNAITGKAEFGVGRSNKKLDKAPLSKLVNLCKQHRDSIQTLKVKMVDNDTIRVIDLINCKLEDEITIFVSKEDPKTFNKILNQISDVFPVTLEETLADLPCKYVAATL